MSKTDLATDAAVAEQLAVAAGELGEFDAYVPLSGLTGDGVDALVGELEARLPEGPEYYPDGVVTDQPETFLVAELVREKLLRVAREELPHSITVVAEEIEPETRRRRAALRGEGARRARVAEGHGDRQGRRGASRRRARWPARSSRRCSARACYLETKVKVDRDWQRRAHALDRLGF